MKKIKITPPLTIEDCENFADLIIEGAKKLTAARSARDSFNEANKHRPPHWITVVTSSGKDAESYWKVFTHECPYCAFHYYDICEDGYNYCPNCGCQMTGKKKMKKEEVIDLLDNLIGMIDDSHGNDYDTALKIAIKSLSQEPIKQTGYWIEQEKGLKITSYKCSKCGRVVMDDTGYDVSKDYPYCHCGAKMIGEIE